MAYPTIRLLKSLRNRASHSHPQSKFKVKSRDLQQSNRVALSLYLDKIDIPSLINLGTTCTEKVSILEAVSNTGLDIICPIRSKTYDSNEPAWINPTLKNLIKERQEALAQDNLPLFRLLRNRVNRERKKCRDKYYKTKLAHLKECKPSIWWREVKKLSGMSSANRHSDDFTKSLQINIQSDKQNLANTINETFIKPMEEFSPLPADFELDVADFPSSEPLVVFTLSVN